MNEENQSSKDGNDINGTVNDLLENSNLEAFNDNTNVTNHHKHEPGSPCTKLPKTCEDVVDDDDQPLLDELESLNEDENSVTNDLVALPSQDLLEDGDKETSLISRMKSSGTSTTSTPSSGISDGSSDSSSAESEIPIVPVDETGEEKLEEERRQIQIAQLKVKQKELRAKVRKLKHAEAASITVKAQSSDIPSPSVSIDKQLLETNELPVSLSPEPILSDIPTNLSSMEDPIQNNPITPPSVKIADTSMPLDLCMKKSEIASKNEEKTLPLNSFGNTTTFMQQSINNQILLPAKMNLSAIPNAHSRRRARKNKPLPSSSLSSSNMDVGNSRKRNINNFSGSQLSSTLPGGSNSSCFDISTLDSPNLGQLLLPSPFNTIEGLRIPDLSSRINPSVPSILGALSQHVQAQNNNSNSRKRRGTNSRTPQDHRSDIMRNVDGSVSKCEQNAKSVNLTVDKRLAQERRHHDGLQRMQDGNKMDSNSSSETETSMDSGSESNSSVNTAASTASSSHTIGGVKRHHDRSDTTPRKRRHLTDDKELRIPLEHGWRRQTRIRSISRSGVKGEVYYYSPCGKKHRNYLEVIRYLQKNNITDINRDNFNFSSKVIVGEFVEKLAGSGAESCVLINEHEVAARIDELRSRKTVNPSRKSESSPYSSAQSRNRELEEKQKKWEEIQMQRRIEQQAIARHNQQLKALKREQNPFRETKRQRATSRKDFEELRKQKELQTLVKHQEAVQKAEHQRIEKEMRNKQLMEDRELKRQQAAILREQEMQKRREMLLMVDLERERRRQHMMLVRALETRKKMEERDKKQKELLQEKELIRMKKLEQRRMEMQMLRDIKKPVEDMSLKNNSPLPNLNRIPGLKISSAAFGDLLMVTEFLFNFGETLGFDMDNLPTLSTLQLALLNHDERNEEELLSLVHHLLVCVIDDPGIPHPRSALTVLGQTLREVDITNSNVSEVLRLFINAMDRHSLMSQWLISKPFLSLNATKKAAILAFLCNELLCSKIVIRQVDNSIDNLNNLKRDKWVVEGQLRRLKAVLQRRKAQLQISQLAENATEGGETVSTPTEEVKTVLGLPVATSSGTNAKAKIKEEDDELLEDVVIDSGNESDETQETGQPSDAEDEEPELSNEELEKKIEKLTKQLSQFQTKLMKSSNTLRATTLGMDRYRRRYWVLPKMGGVFVESQESAEILKCESFPLETLEMRELEEERLKSLGEVEEETVTEKDENQMEVDKEDAEKEEKEEVEMEEEVKEKEQPCIDCDTSALVIDETIKPEPTEKSEPDEKAPEDAEEKPEVKTEEAEEAKPSDSTLTPKSDKENAADAKPSTPDKNWLMHSPLFASLLTGSLLMNGPLNGSYLGSSHPNLKGTTPSASHTAAAAAAVTASSSAESPFNPFLGLPSEYITAEQIMKHFNDPNANRQQQQRNWFSIMPKTPCDNISLVQLPGNPSTNKGVEVKPRLNIVKPVVKDAPSKTEVKTELKSEPKSENEERTSNMRSTIAPPPLEATNKITASALANLQLGLLNGIPPDILMHSFMAAHGIGPLYQAGAANNPQVANMSALPQPLQLPPLTSASNVKTELSERSVAEGSETQTGESTGLLGDGLEAFAKQLEDSKKAMLSKMQYDEPLPIPIELQFGWWRITEISQLRTLMNNLNHQGVREKILQKHIEKYLSYSTSVCSASQLEHLDLEITDLDSVVSARLGGAPEVDSEEHWVPEVALRVDLAILEHVEGLEDKISGASMQIKDLINNHQQGWKTPTKLTSDKNFLFRAGCTFPPLVAKDRKWGPVKADEVEVVINDEKEPEEQEDDGADNLVIDMDTKTDDDSAQVDAKPLGDDSEAEKLEEFQIGRIYKPGELINPVEVARDRLLKVESVIERRYMRPPLGTSSGTPSASQMIYGQDDLTPGLIKWRRAVQNCLTSAQLSLCINMLENCIAWDKSIMRASCQFCHNGDNEEKLLLCDGCDKGYHTYCFKPKMENIPEGDWYCYECLNKATGDKVCILCGKRGNKIVECEGCPKTFHIACLEPPLTKVPKGKWYCPGCNHKQPKKSNKSKSKDKDAKEKDKSVLPSTSTSTVDKELKDSLCSTPNSTGVGSPSTRVSKDNSETPKSSKSKDRKDRTPKIQGNKDLLPATIIISELESHEDAWPFLLPVNSKQFPTYRKVIKKSMDLHTMKNRLESGTYKFREEFSNDARLIFDNCETFNEDDSPVGIAGHNMRAFFECRWAELCNT